MSEEMLARAKEWCAGLGTVEDGEGSFALSSTAGSTDPVEVAAEEGAIVVRGAVTVDPSGVAPAPNAPPFADVVRGFAVSRAGLLAASVVEAAEGLQVRVELPVHEDGLSRNAFLSAVAEVRKAVEGVRSLVEDFRRQRELLAGLEAMAATSVTEAEPEPLPEAPEPDPEPLPASAPAVAASEPVMAAPVVPPAWTRTHVVPAGGMPTWDAADPTRQPITTLQAGVELQVLEMLGAWAHVRAANGWAGWVDGRILVPSP